MPIIAPSPLDKSWQLQSQHNLQPFDPRIKDKDDIKEMEGETSIQNPPDKSTEVESMKDQSDPSVPKPPNKKEVPVINIKNFSAVDMEEKLNLLMVAINKINTNFHLKFEEWNKRLYTGDDAVVTRIVNCETSL